MLLLTLSVSIGVAYAAPAQKKAQVNLPLAEDPGLSPETLHAMVVAQGGVVLRGLDKITAKVTNIDAPLDVPVNFGSLRITARSCHKRPPEETPEQSVFVEVDEIKTGHPPQRLFTGWMFWSSPALSALEHPVYDISLIDCIAKEPEQTTGRE